MRIAISGTYSSGKTTTSIALSHLAGIPRTHARTMREILPDALAGRTLEDATPAELVQLFVRRHVERAVRESHLPQGFISDGSSLHEWVYGTVRGAVGIHPADTSEEQSGGSPTAELTFFGDVVANLGTVAMHHAKRSYDVFIHLPIEFPLVLDGHRPVSERFRSLSDTLLLETLDELRIPYEIVGGTVAERLTRIVEILDLRRFTSVDEAISHAEAELAMSTERERHHREATPRPAR